MGRKVQSAAATIGTGGATAALTTDYMNSIGNVAGIDGAPVGGVWISTTEGTNLMATLSTVSSWTFAFGRDTSIGRGIAGDTGFTDAEIGKINATVDMTVILNDTTKALFTGAEAHSTYSLGWAVVDAQGNRVCFSIPASKVVGDITIADNDERYEIPLQFKSHDPAEDSNSEYVADTFNHEIAMFHVPI